MAHKTPSTIFFFFGYAESPTKRTHGREIPSAGPDPEERKSFRAHPYFSCAGISARSIFTGSPTGKVWKSKFSMPLALWHGGGREVHLAGGGG